MSGLRSTKSLRIEDQVLAASQRFDMETVFRLALNGRYLSAIPLLPNCANLTELNLAGNSIAKIENLQVLTSLIKLDLSNNKISVIENVYMLSKLEQLKLKDNQLHDMASLNLKTELKALPTLKVLYLQDIFISMEAFPGNKCCLDKDYKRIVMTALPQLTNLDGERKPGASNYAAIVNDTKRDGGQPLPKPNWTIPEVTPWLDDRAIEQIVNDLDSKLPDAVDQQQKTLVKELDKCHMLFEVMNNEMQLAQQALESRPSTG